MIVRGIARSIDHLVAHGLHSVLLSELPRVGGALLRRSPGETSRPARVAVGERVGETETCGRGG